MERTTMWCPGRVQRTFVCFLHILILCACSKGQSNEIQEASLQRPSNREILTYTDTALRKYLGAASLNDSVKEGLNNVMNALREKVYFNQTVTVPSSCTNLNSVPAENRQDEERLCQSLQTRCLSIDQLVRLLVTDDSVATKFPSALKELCPLLLFQSHDPECSKPVTTESTGEPEMAKSTASSVPSKSSNKPSASAVWGFGFLFVTVVSCCSLVGVALLPLLSKNIYQTVLVLFEGLAVGSLAASALFHLIPQAFGLLGQDLEHKYLWRSLIIFGGIYLFFLSERGMKIIIQNKQHRKLKRDNADVASLTMSPSNLSNSSHVIGNGKPALSIHDMVNKENGNVAVGGDAEANCITHVHHGHSHGGPVAFNTAPTSKDGAKQTIATVAWMIIFGDGLHNFIDGLSMGAAFSESILSGISISVAVICEEFPHELGDFAVLLSAGMTLKQALMYNFLSACTCYLGLVFGIILGDIAEGGPYIFALAGGMFLYISLVDMVGELSEAMEEASLKGTREMLKVFGLQNLGILIGVATLFLMARYSEKINFDSLSHYDGGFQEENAQMFSSSAAPLL